MLFDVKESDGLTGSFFSVEGEYGNLGTHVEANPHGVTQGPIDIKPSAVIEIDFSRRVAPILDRQLRRVEKGRLALAPMRVAAEDPSLVAVPNGQICPVGVVTQHQMCLVRPQFGQGSFRLEGGTPQIIEPGYLQASDIDTGVA